MVIEIAVEPDASQRDDGLAELLRRVAIRDQGAFAELYDTMAPQMNGVIAAMLGADRTEETLTQAFHDVWKQTLISEAWRHDPRAWMLSVARRCAVDRIRVTERTLDSAGESNVATSTMPALDALPSNERRVLDLAFRGGLDEHRIAVRLGLSRSAVRTTMRSAMTALRAQTARGPLADGA